MTTGRGDCPREYTDELVVNILGRGGGKSKRKHTCHVSKLGVEDSLQLGRDGYCWFRRRDERHGGWSRLLRTKSGGPVPLPPVGTI